MRTLTLFLVALMSMAFFACETDDTTAPIVEEEGYLVINEFLASNDDTNTDENGDYDDWVELYNGTNEAVDVGGMYISDDPEDTAPWPIPTTDASLTTIEAGGYLVLWCDKESEQGVLHVDIKLSGDGEAIVLWDADMVEVDSYTFGPQETGVSMGRTEDGGDTWASFTTPTPGASNQ